MTKFRLLWDRLLAGAFAVAGAVALLLGWLGVKDKLYVAQQIPYVLSGGLVGLFLLGLAATLWLSADLRDEWRKLDELTRHRAPDDELPVDDQPPEPVEFVEPVQEPVPTDPASTARTNGRRKVAAR